MRPLKRSLALTALVDRFGGVLSDPQAGSTVILRLSPLESAQHGDLGFLAQAKYLKQAIATNASAVLVQNAIQTRAAQWIVKNPYATYAKVSQHFAELLAEDFSIEHELDREPSVSPKAIIHSSATIAPRVQIMAGVVVEAGACIQEGAILHSGVVIGKGAQVGADCELHPNVTVYAGCEIGARGIIPAGTVIGSDGFGFAKDGQEWVKIAQLGAVVIGEDVEIGSNCSIDRGAMDDTVIGRGVKIDNLVQIAHNVRVGEGTAIAGCVGIAGSAIIGTHCALGGSAGVLGHLEICDHVTISSMSLVTRSISTPGFYSGVFPLQDNADWERVAVSLKQLPQFRQRLRELERAAKTTG